MHKFRARPRGSLEFLCMWRLEISAGRRVDLTASMCINYINSAPNGLEKRHASKKKLCVRFLI